MCGGIQMERVGHSARMCLYTVSVCVSVEGEECPAQVQLSKHVPVSCRSAPVMEK